MKKESSREKAEKVDRPETKMNSWAVLLGVVALIAVLVAGIFSARRVFVELIPNSGGRVLDTLENASDDSDGSSRDGESSQSGNGEEDRTFEDIQREIREVNEKMLSGEMTQEEGLKRLAELEEESLDLLKQS